MHVRVLLSRYRRYDECPTCHGTRFKPGSLAYTIEGRSIADFFALPVRAARSFIEALAREVLGRRAGRAVDARGAVAAGTRSTTWGSATCTLDRAPATR